MRNIFKIWFFTAIFLLTRRKYFKDFEKFDEEKKEKEIFTLLREFDTYILKKIKMEVEVLQEENAKTNEAVLYVSNHPSMLDPMFLLKVVDYPISFFVAKESRVILKIPYGKNFYKYMKNIYIDRNNIKSGVKSIKEGKQRLREGFNLAIFPEGQITKVISDDVVGEFKGGSFKTAMDEGKNIIPISIIGAENIQKKPSIFSAINSKKVIVKVHSKVEYDTIKDLKANEVALHVKNIIKKGMEES